MHTVVATTSYPRYDDDASGRFVAASVRSLREAGSTVEVLAPDHPGPRLEGREPSAVRYAPWRRWQTLCYGDGVLPNLRRSPRRLLLVPGLCVALSAALHRRRRLPVVAHWLVPTALCAVGAGVDRLLAVAHGSDVALLERLPLGRAMAQTIADRVRAVTFASRDLMHRFCALVDRPPHCEWLPPAFDRVDPLPRAQARRQLGLSGDRPTALFVGRLVENKGVDVLLHALARIPGAICLVAGRGPLQSDLEARAGQLGLDSRFLGAIKPSQLGALFGAVDVLALPSRPGRDGHAEGTPSILLAALGAGVPVVASAVGGVPEVIQHGRSGLLVPPGDSGALGDQLTRLFGGADLRARLARGAQEAVQELLPVQHGRRLLTLLG